MKRQIHNLSLLYCLKHISDNFLYRGFGAWLPKPVVVRIDGNDQKLTDNERKTYGR